MMGLSLNYSHAALAYGSEDLIGIIFGKQESKIITNVFFTLPNNENNDLKNLINEFKSFLPPEIYFLGLVFTHENTSLNSLISNLSIDNNPSLKLYWPIEAIKAKNFSKLLECSSELINDEILSIADGVFIKCQLFAAFKVEDGKNFDDEIKLQISKKKSELSELVFLYEETKSTFSKESKISSLTKIQKSNKKNYILLKGKGNLFDKSENKEENFAKLDVLIKVSNKFSDLEVFEYLSQQIEKLFDQIQALFLREKKLIPIISNTFLLSGWSILLNIISIDNDDDNLKREQRKSIHKLLNLSADGPRIRLSQSLKFEESDSKLLVNPHEGIKYTQIGQMAIVKGKYQYHHYMQDNFDDSGWGCAYRSFQTIWSWFILQGYTDKPVPTHKEIQQCLVNIGDKQAKFVGSRQWIGSMELSYCLETMLGIQSRILTTNSGKDVVEHCRALIYHFDNNGSPVMIGGGQLAHTILGIDYNTKTGDCKFLVLDPHYTGEENLNLILKKGWCAWKPLSFWNPKSFYNLMLPINPKSDV